MPTGHCHCGAIRYEVAGEPKWSALCHYFCAECGTGLFYYNAVNLPGIADVQIATLDDPSAITPQIHVQTAERLAWMERAHELPAFSRYPGKT